MKDFNWLKRASALFAFCLLFLPFFGHAQSTKWNDWLATQIEQDPDIIAARERWLGSNFSADVIEQPIYNPELSTELERDGDENNFSVGVQQTIDWWDKRGVKQQQAKFLRTAAEAQYREQVLNKTADALDALVEWYFANRAAMIAQTQKQQFDTLLELVEKRQQAGDLGSIDAELTFLTLSQQLVQLTEVEVSLKRAQTRVHELLPKWSPEQGGIPNDFWPSPLNSVTEQELLKHPTVVSAYDNWQFLKEEAKVRKLAAKAEPTFGINAGRDEGERVIGLTFSIPLNIRNSFNAETRVAENKAIEAEARFQSLFRKQRFDWKAAHDTWQRYKQQYSRWQTVVQDRVLNSAQLFERQWLSGDLSTPNYLLALNQRAESLLAGIQLEKQTQQALIQVLKQSGLLDTEAIPVLSLTN